jgi:tRNA dimethylallyltransferase
MTEKRDLPLAAIVGPTASGKTTLAVKLALELGGEVVACDSTQLYRGLDIGTAKPDMAERGGVPHHLIDVLEPAETATAGGYRERAIRVLEELRTRGRLPLFTVGTGLYLRVLLEGLADVPQRSEELRERLRESAGNHAPGHLHKLLKKLDADSAKRIVPSDKQKLIRAVEVCVLTKKPLSEAHQSGRTSLKGWRAIKIGLAPDRDALYERVHARTEAMLERGWLEEVRKLVASGLPANAKAYEFIGYRELRAVVQGELKLEEARATIQQATRRYAKRQMTWFRRESGVKWLAGFGDEELVQQQALAWIRAEVAGVSGAGEMDV